MQEKSKYEIVEISCEGDIQMEKSNSLWQIVPEVK